jgi:hypothetical protein
MMAGLIARVVPPALLAASLVLTVVNLGVLRPVAEERMEFFRVRAGREIVLRSAPDRHAERADALREDVRFHLTSKRQGGFVFVRADRYLAAWLAEEDWRERTTPCQGP